MYTLNLTTDQLNIIILGIGELQAKISHDLINEIEKQIKEQTK